MATIWITHPKKSKAPTVVLEYLMAAGFDAQAADKGNCLTVSGETSSVAVTAIAASPKESGKMTVPAGLLESLKKKLSNAAYMSIVIRGRDTSSWNVGNYTEKGSNEHQAIVEALSVIIKAALDEDKIARIYDTINGKSEAGATKDVPKDEMLWDEEDEAEKKPEEPAKLTKDFSHFDKLLQVMRKTVTISDTFFECTREERQEIVEALEQLA